MNRPLVVSLVLLAAPAWAQTPAGSEFRVNTYTTAGQFGPLAASDAAGDFVLVWQSDGQSGVSDVYAQRYDAAGTPLGGEFRVNPAPDFRVRPAVGRSPSGPFVVVWSENNHPPDRSFGVFGQRYDAAGAALGAEFQVNTYTTGAQYWGGVAVDASGNFVVVWESGQDGSSYGVRGQRFSSSGTPLGGEFQVNSYTTGVQGYPSLGMDPSGNFVVVWQSNGQDGSGMGVFGQRFAAAGTPVGGEFQVNTSTLGYQTHPNVALDANGRFVVVWSSNIGYAVPVVGRRFDASGALGGEFLVSDYTTGIQDSPTVSSDPVGNFVVSWSNYIPGDGNQRGVSGRVFDSSGNPVTAEFAVNTYTTSFQGHPSVAVAATGDFVVVWDSYGQVDATDVFAQRYSELIFKDGFETDDLSRWSTSANDGGDLHASGAAALRSTSFGLEGVINDTNGLYVEDDSPNAESRYRARFYFDPHGFDPGEAQSHFRTRIFLVFAANPTRRVAAVVLKRQAGQYSVEGRARLDSGAQDDTGFFPITDAPHWVELDLKRSSGPGANDGSFRLWIDGTLVSTLTGIDNDLTAVDFVRLGALSVKTGASGTIFWDEFESRRNTDVGPRS